MKQLFLLFFLTNSLFAFYLSDKLPKESVTLINSYECFSKDDRQILYSYLLALRYRIDHVEDKDTLVKSDLEYWRLWHLTSDIANGCGLTYKFDDILEETITQTKQQQKSLKKLRRVESSIRSAGASESSAKMDKFDQNLKKKLLSNPPKFTLIDTNNSLQDYDLTQLKQYPPNTIPKEIYDHIKAKKLTKLQENLLFRSAYLNEEILRNYDKPQQRKRMNQELIYLDKCQSYYNTYLQSSVLLNNLRKLAQRSLSTTNYSLKREFLPNEIESYCENNITQMDLSPIEIKKDTTLKKEKKTLKFANSNTFIANYQGDPKLKEKMQTYLAIVSRQMQNKGDVLMDGLRSLRLNNCFEDKGVALDKQILEDILNNDLKEEYFQKVFKHKLWWMMTIKMKIDTEGESEELKHFFDCNQTSVLEQIQKNSSQNSPKLQKPRFTQSNMRDAIKQKDNILKYYAKIFSNQPTPDLNNKKAIDAGIIERRWIDKNEKITTPLGDSVKIEGMKKGGIKLTYTGVPKGELCTQFIQLNKNDTLHFNNESYEGIDYILLNDKKIKLDAYVYKYVQRECSQHESNTISFVKEGMIKKESYKTNPETLSAFENVKKIKKLQNTPYLPDSFAYTKTQDIFMVTGNQAKLYSAKEQKFLQKLPRELEGAYHTALSPNGAYLAVQKYGSLVYIFDIKQNKIIAKIQIDSQDRPELITFLSDNKTLVFKGKKVSFLDITTQKFVAQIEPRFIDPKKLYASARISAVVQSPDKQRFYIASDKNKIERWSKDFHYIDQIEDINFRTIGALLFDPRDPNILIIASKKDKIMFWDIKQKKIVKTLIADDYMGCEQITLNDSREYFLATGTHGVFLWKLSDAQQLDILKSPRIKGAFFLPNSSDFITIDKDLNIWKIIK